MLSFGFYFTVLFGRGEIMSLWRLFIGVMSVAILSLSACGQKGPLYLPDEDEKAAQSNKQ
jgi:hypothetical protein